MANLSNGYELCQAITDLLNSIIVNSGKQIDKNEKAIWDGFLHQATNQDWEDIFAAFKHMINTGGVHLTHYQQTRFDEAYTTFQQDKHRRERCMDIKYKFKNTKVLSWGMIMVIREVVNTINGVDIPNKDIVKPTVTVKRGRYEQTTVNGHTTLTLFDDLFE
jgi:hypothetical protein